MSEGKSKGFKSEMKFDDIPVMVFSSTIWHYPDDNQYVVQDEDFQEALFKMIKLSEVKRFWVEVDKNGESVWEEYPDFKKHRTFYRLQMYSPPDGYRFISSYAELSNGLSFGANGIYTMLTFPSKQQAYELFTKIYKTSVAEIKKLEGFPPEKGILNNPDYSMPPFRSKVGHPFRTKVGHPFRSKVGHFWH